MSDMLYKFQNDIEKMTLSNHEYILYNISVHMFNIHSVGDFHGQRMLQYIDKD